MLHSTVAHLQESMTRHHTELQETISRHHRETMGDVSRIAEILAVVGDKLKDHERRLAAVEAKVH
jgi:ferritin-like metal-binding protein YciE